MLASPAIVVHVPLARLKVMWICWAPTVGGREAAALNIAVQFAHVSEEIELSVPSVLQMRYQSDRRGLLKSRPRC